MQTIDIPKHNQLTDRDTAGNHAKIIPTTDSTTAIQITKADGTTAVINVDTTNNNVGVGTTTPLAKVDISGGTGGADDEGLKVSGTYSDQTAHPMRVASTHPLANGKAVAFYDARGFITGAANTNHAVGYQCDITNSSSGTMTDFYGIYIRDVLSSGCTVTSRYAIYLSAIANSGTIVNNYGLYIAPVVNGTTLNYNIYAPGTNDNHLGGKLGIGTTTPSEKLDVVGDIKASGDIHLPNTGTTIFGAETTTNSGRMRYDESTQTFYLEHYNGSAWVV